VLEPQAAITVAAAATGRVELTRNMTQVVAGRWSHECNTPAAGVERRTRSQCVMALLSVVVHDVRVRVLVVEDHVELARDIAEGLRDRGIATDLAYDGSAALQKGVVYRYDVIVLDRDLPGVHGDAVCVALRDGGADARILMLTAAAAIGDRGLASNRP